MISKAPPRQLEMTPHLTKNYNQQLPTEMTRHERERERDLKEKREVVQRGHYSSQVELEVDLLLSQSPDPLLQLPRKHSLSAQPTNNEANKDNVCMFRHRKLIIFQNTTKYFKSKPFFSNASQISEFGACNQCWVKTRTHTKISN